jgi:hypothetical protein
MAATKKKTLAAKKSAKKSAGAKKKAKSVYSKSPSSTKKPPRKPAAAKRAAPAAKKKPKSAAAKKAAAPVQQKPSAAQKSVARARKKTTTAANSQSTRSVKPQATRSVKPQAAPDALDLGAIPPAFVARHTTSLCLACIFDLFTGRLGLAPRTAYNEIRRHAPAIEELTTKEPQRPYFHGAGKHPRCPYCDAAQRWHAQLSTYRIEGGKATDAARRALCKTLPARDERFQFVERKSTARAAFFDWLERLGQELDFEGDDRVWLLAAARAYLERREPKTDWAAAFDGARHALRSRRLAEGWERESNRLFLAPALYGDVLVVQYLVSRSHRHGGRTFEGRLTLPEFVRRLRFSGHLAAHNINERDHFDVLEKLVEQLTGGDAPLKLHFIIDRRDLLEKVKDVYARYA